MDFYISHQPVTIMENCMDFFISQWQPMQDDSGYFLQVLIVKPRATEKSPIHGALFCLYCKQDGQFYVYDELETIKNDIDNKLYNNYNLKVEGVVVNPTASQQEIVNQPAFKTVNEYFKRHLDIALIANL